MSLAQQPTQQTDPYTAQAPGRMGTGAAGGFYKQAKLVARGFWRLIYQVFIPYNSLPEFPADPPDPPSEVSEEVVAQCQKIYDDVEATRKYLEDKARSTSFFFCPSPMN